ncbi:MAG TPA: efflux RND transporter periplasmic adaptor subunit [Anaerolineales bacterium]|nr:efflux RND transporter periplasmic adaptor subunit [Anaerolineales bacterium]
MKKLTLIALILLAVVLTACSGNTAPTAIPTVVLGSKPSTAAGGASGSDISASGEVVPEQHASLSFPLTGTVKTVDVKAGDKVSQGQTLVTLDTTLLDAQEKQAEADLAAAVANEKYLFRIGEDQEHIDAANADIDKAQAAVDLAKATLAQATLTAPFDGTVASLDISPAETVVPGQEVIQLGDLSTFQVETTDLSERDAPLVQTGQKATVTVTALNDTFPGKVTDVSHISSTVGGDVVYKVTIQFDTQPKGLLWGMTTDVGIETK